MKWQYICVVVQFSNTGQLTNYASYNMIIMSNTNFSFALNTIIDDVLYACEELYLLHSNNGDWGTSPKDLNLALWMSVQCSYQLRHCNSEIGADDR